MAAAVRAITRYGDGAAANAHGGWPGRPGSTGSITDGPRTATVKVSATLTAMAASPARPARSARGTGDAAGPVLIRGRAGPPAWPGRRAAPAAARPGPGPRPRTGAPGAAGPASHRRWRGAPAAPRPRPRAGPGAAGRW